MTHATYLATLLIAIINGMIMLLLPLFTVEIGISMVGIGSLVAARGIGVLIADLPAGIAIQRFGEKKLLQFSLLLIVASCMGIVLWHSWLSLLFFVTLFGVGIGGWSLAQHSFISTKAPNHQHGRSLSKLVVFQRSGFLVGPVIGGGISHYDSFEAAFFIATLFALIALTLCSLTLPRYYQQRNPISVKAQFIALPGFIIRYQQIFKTAAVYVMILRLVRGARQFLLPLWGHYIGLNAAEIGLIFGLSAAIDLALLYAGGQISDRWGRKWVAVPCLTLLSLSLLLMPFALTFNSFLLLALFAGAANGLGGGIMMTLGSDLAPKENRSTFLGAWRLLGDISGTLSPLFIGWIGSTFALASAATLSGGIGLLGSAVMIFWVKETLIKPKKES